MLAIRNLSKTYDNGIQALKDVSLEIPSGMFGLVGPNGAGKSTLMRTLATLQDGDTGSVTLGDLNVLRDKQEARKDPRLPPPGVRGLSPGLRRSHARPLRGAEGFRRCHEAQGDRRGLAADDQSLGGPVSLLLALLAEAKEWTSDKPPPPIKILVADASGTSVVYKEDRGIGAAGAAKRQIAA